MDKDIKDAYNKALVFKYDGDSWITPAKTTSLKPDPGVYNWPIPTSYAPHTKDGTIKELGNTIVLLQKELQEKEEAIKELQLALKQILEVKGGQAT
jgi:hypothetical protein